MNRREARISALDVAWKLVDQAARDMMFDLEIANDRDERLVRKELDKIAQGLFERWARYTKGGEA